MSTSSAIPEYLQAFANVERDDAEQLLMLASVLDQATARFEASCPFNTLIASSSPRAAVDELRSAGRRLLRLAEDTGFVGSAFARADNRHSFLALVSVDDRTLTRLQSGFDPTSALAVDLVALTPVERHRLISQLDRRTQQQLVRHHPDMMGNTDGVPWRLRVAANQVLVDRELDRAEAGGDQALITLLRRLQHEQVIVFDPRKEHLAVVHGDLDSAENIAVFIPGMGSTFTGFFDGNNGTDNKAAALYREANAAHPGSTAVIAWLGYAAPTGQDVDPVRAIAEVGSDKHAKQGAKNLKSFVQGLALSDGRRLTLVGHSYGTLVVGLALKAGTPADEVVLAGSPGIGVDRVGELDAQVTGTVSVLSAPGDVVADLAYFGHDPDAPSFGATRLTTNAAGRPRVEAHANYFVEGSQSLRNMAAVVTGDGPKRQQATSTDHVRDVIQRAGRQHFAVPEKLVTTLDKSAHGVSSVPTAAAKKVIWIAETAPAHVVGAAASGSKLLVNKIRR